MQATDGDWLSLLLDPCIENVSLKFSLADDENKNTDYWLEF